MDYASKMQVATYVGVEDFADKFNFIFTVLVLIICTTVVTVKQYILKPISCYISTEVGGKNLLDYVENYCWVQGTIPISYSNTVPETEDEWNILESRKIRKYCTTNFSYVFTTLSSSDILKSHGIQIHTQCENLNLVNKISKTKVIKPLLVLICFLSHFLV